MKNLLIIIAAATILLSCGKNPDEKKAKRPNIILIMSDDHACQAISAYGSDLIQTPNIDRLAGEGMIFQNSFVTNSICSPSRAVALTGKFSHLNGVRDNLERFDSSQVTFPKILRENGYQTAVVGKWHLKSEPTGFDYWKILPDQGNYYDPEFLTPEGIVTDHGYVTDIITDIAADFIKSIRDTKKPFLLMYNHKAPHRQWWPSMEDIGAFADKEIPEPETLFDDYPGRGAAAKDAEMRIADHMALSMDNKINPDILKKLGIEEFYDWYENNYTERYNRLNSSEKEKWDAVYGPINEDFEKNTPKGKALTKWKYRRYMEDYLGTILSVDRNTGRLLDLLDEEGLAENTIVIYTSDQGFFLGEHGWFDKRFMYEESFRTPLLIRWPGKIQPGSVNEDLVQNIDYAPTILEAAGTAVPAEMQGMSMIPLFSGNNDNWRRAVYYHYYEYPGIHSVKRHYGIRTKDFKLIHFYYDVDEWELYDLTMDPHEMNNVYGDGELSRVAHSLRLDLMDLREKYGDSEELDQKFIKKDLEKLR